MPVYAYIPAFTIPLSAFIGMYLGDIYSFITPVYVFLLLPLIEKLVGENKTNPDPEYERKVKASLSYSFLLWTFVPLQWSLTLYFLFLVGNLELTGLELAGAILSVGISNGGTGITIAHELIHCNGRFEQWLGRLLLLSTCYMHFAIEHVYGHHKNVATPDDPATARKGESFYRFWIRTVPEQYLSAWKIELQRLKKFCSSFLSMKNEMLVMTFIQVSFLVAVLLIWGPFTLLAFLASSVVAFTLLEAVNYLEHYGLERHHHEKGYEKVGHEHSWNSDYSISRMFLFELSRHSDHHAVASRKYQILRSFDESPQLPTGYPGMILLALIPPLWFKVMDPLVEIRENLR